jgi:16S rRNA (guanine527-N7)-methyltransferase
VRLVESVQRKAAFLRAVAQAAGLRTRILDRRIEELPPQAADVISARALAPLDVLLGHAEKHLRPEGIGLFPKGETVHKELADAKIRWRFEQKLHPSLTDPRGAIVEIGAVNRA